MRNIPGILIIIIVCMLILGVVGYGKNFIKLISCDFEAPYKAEIIHGIGIVPAVGGITGWLDFGK
ncbi:MAG: hypothetical protein OEL83_19335 [Desulforhopalus sp.]|nr:hypothetical protein [Desulforhopalus sp.]